MSFSFLPLFCLPLTPSVSHCQMLIRSKIRETPVPESSTRGQRMSLKRRIRNQYSKIHKLLKTFLKSLLWRLCGELIKGSIFNNNYINIYIMIQKSKNTSRETSQQTITVVQASNDGGLNQDKSSGDRMVIEWIDFFNVLEVDPIGFVDK